MGHFTWIIQPVCWCLHSNFTKYLMRYHLRPQYWNKESGSEMREECSLEKIVLLFNACKWRQTISVPSNWNSCWGLSCRFRGHRELHNVLICDSVALKGQYTPSYFFLAWFLVAILSRTYFQKAFHQLLSLIFFRAGFLGILIPGATNKTDTTSATKIRKMLTVAHCSKIRENSISRESTYVTDWFCFKLKPKLLRFSNF